MFLLVQIVILLWGMAVQCTSPHPSVDICLQLTWAGHQSAQEILGSVWLDPVHVPGIQAGSCQANQGLSVLRVPQRTSVEN